MKKNEKLVSKLMVLIVLVAIGSAFIIGLKLADYNKEPAIISIMNIEGNIKEIGELATMEYGYLIAQTAEKPNRTVVGLEVPFTNSRVIYSYEGLIKAGINFNEIKVKVNEVNKTISVDLPDADILSSEVDFDSLIVYDEKNNPFNAFTFSDMNLNISEAQIKAEESALSKGLLVRAAENAQSMIRTTVMSFYDLGEYEIEFH
ncbi:MAG: DUF4230 domain-containing protein [Proteocatella sp.]